MCNWSPLEPGSIQVQLEKTKEVSRRLKPCDGVPRFARDTKRDRLKLFVDSDGDGLFTKAAALVGRARIKRPFRGQGRGELLEEGTFGTILTFNGLETTIVGRSPWRPSNDGGIFLPVSSR